MLTGLALNVPAEGCSRDEKVGGLLVSSNLSQSDRAWSG